VRQTVPIFKNTIFQIYNWSSPKKWTTQWGLTTRRGDPPTDRPYGIWGAFYRLVRAKFLGLEFNLLSYSPEIGQWRKLSTWVWTEFLLLVLVVPPKKE